MDGWMDQKMFHLIVPQPSRGTTATARTCPKQEAPLAAPGEPLVSPVGTNWVAPELGNSKPRDPFSHLGAKRHQNFINRHMDIIDIIFILVYYSDIV